MATNKSYGAGGTESRGGQYGRLIPTGTPVSGGPSVIEPSYGQGAGPYSGTVKRSDKHEPGRGTRHRAPKNE